MNGNLMNKLFVGLTLIAVGVLFLLDQTGIVSFDVGDLFSVFWPVILIWLGLKGIIVQRKNQAGWGGAFIGSMIMIVIGAYFLFSNLHIEGFADFNIYKFLVPVVLIVIGLSMFFRSSRRGERHRDWQSWQPPHVPPGPRGPNPDRFGDGERESNLGQEGPWKQPHHHEHDWVNNWNHWKTFAKEQWKHHKLEGKKVWKEQWKQHKRQIRQDWRAHRRDWREKWNEERREWHEAERQRRSAEREGWVDAPAARGGDGKQKSWEPDWAELERRAAEAKPDGAAAQPETADAYERRMEALERELAQRQAAESQQGEAPTATQAEPAAKAAADAGQAADNAATRVRDSGDRPQRKHDHTHLHWHDHNIYTRSSFIGDIHLGREFWELEPMNVSHFIGDTVIDLTTASIPYGETRINVSAFIGDVKLFVPNDMQVEVKVIYSAFIGDMKVFKQHEGGLFRNMQMQTPNYNEGDKKICVHVSMFIGDVVVKRVG